MNPKDRIEVREMLTDILSGPLAEIKGQYRLVSSQLSNIEILTTKTNGKVERHEKIINENLPHTISNCAQKDTIKEIWDNTVSSKAIKKTIITSIAATGTLLTILFILYQMFINK